MAGRPRIPAKQIPRAIGLVAERNVAALARRIGERDANEIGGERVEGGGLRVHGHHARLMGGGDDRVEGGHGVDGGIGRAVDLVGAGLVCAGCGQRGGHGLAAVLSGRGGVGLRVEGRLRAGGGFVHLAIAQTPPAGAHEGGVGRDLIGVHLVDFGGAAGDGGEFQRLQKGDQLARIGLVQAKIIERNLHLHIGAEIHELARHAHEIHDLRIGQGLPPLGLLDLTGAGQQGFEVAIFVDELGGGLHADARRARHIVGGIARQRLHIHNPIGRHAEIIDHLGLADAPLLAGARIASHARGGIEHGDAGPDQLHQVLVGGDDEHIGAAFAGLPGIGGDEIVRLIAVLLDRDQAEGPHGLTHQGKLGNQILRRVAAVGLVEGVELLAEGILGFVEDDGQMGRLDARRPLPDELEQLGAEQAHRAGGQAIRAVIVFLVLPDRLEIGAEDEIRPVHEKDMVAGLNIAMGEAHGIRVWLENRAGP